MKVHIGHSTISGATCGTGSAKDGDRDITVSEWAFFREIAYRHRCTHCTAIHFPHGGSWGYYGDRTNEVLDRYE